MQNIDEIVRDNLTVILNEICDQPNLSVHYGGGSLSFEEEMNQIRECIEEAGEYGIAYESLISNLEQVPFVVSGKAAIALLEAGLVMGYKTEIEKDRIFDRR